MHFFLDKNNHSKTLQKHGLRPRGVIPKTTKQTHLFFMVGKTFFYNQTFYLNETIILGGQGPYVLVFVCFDFLVFSVFFTFVFGHVEFDLQNTALSRPRVCSAYSNLYDFKGGKRGKQILEKRYVLRSLSIIVTTLKQEFCFRGFRSEAK